MASPSYPGPRPERRRVRRFARPVLAGAVLLGLAVTAVPASASEALEAGPVADPAGLAVLGLTSAEAGAGAMSAIPRDFEERVGYRPVLRQGLLVAPHGDCSSPVELPPEFDTACMAHDLGYDLLRYADRTGAPLGPWARQSLDRSLEARMHTACEIHDEPVVRGRCETLAGVAATAVELNSRRQHYGVPVVETFTQAATQAATDHPTQPWLLRVVGLVLAALTVLVLGARRLHRRLRGSTTPHRVVLPVRPSEIGAAGRARRVRTRFPDRRPTKPPLADSVPFPKLPALPIIRPGRPAHREPATVDPT